MDIKWMIRPGPRNWEGDVHTLIVHSVDEPFGEGDAGDLDYNIEHPPSCKQQECDVAQAEEDVGLAWSLQYSGTPVTEPGTYRIRGWGRRYPTELGDEYDGGVRVMQESDSA